MVEKGLTSEEVKRLTKEGKVNYTNTKASKGAIMIIASNIFTYFNFIFAGLATILIMVGAIKNLTFLPVIIANIIIGIYQQLRAKKTLDKLALLDVTEFIAVRDGQEQKVDSRKLVEGDLIKIESGQQVPADAVVVSGEAGVNESLLTGEPDEIEKKKGSELKSGSFLVSGTVYAKLTRVGKESYINQLTSKAKVIKDKKSEMIKDIDRIIRVAGVLIIPVGGLLLYQSIYVNHLDFSESVPPMVSAVIGMIPEGMYLLATVALALSAARLAKLKVLLHDMRSIETLARVDVLCVDKTGTITSDKMVVTDVFSAKKAQARQDSSEKLLAQYVNTIKEANITMRALKKYFGVKEPLNYTEILPFSSKTKYSQITTKEAIYRLGAPEFILSEDEFQKHKFDIEKYTSTGKRVIAFVREKDGVVEPLVFVALHNELRDNAKEIFDYFEKQEVQIKVISGDNPLTVSKVAQEAHINNAHKYVDATTLSDYNDIKKAVTKYTIFGRVQPEQKQQIIKAIKETGLKVAMTGDGVNDILAMKEADCSIAMGEGSDATRQAAQVVLLDNDFSHMKNIVYEGRRDINNITRSATLFLYKNIFSLLLGLFAIVAVFKYPLQPTQVSMISGFNIGLPAFFLALEPNEKKQKEGFIKQVLIKAIPSALTSFFAIIAMISFAELFGIPKEEVGTASTYLIAVVGFSILWEISRPVSRYRLFVILGCILGFILSARFLSSVFDINNISIKAWVLCALFALAEMTIIRDITYALSLLLRKKKINIKS